MDSTWFKCSRCLCGFSIGRAGDPCWTDGCSGTLLSYEDWLYQAQVVDRRDTLASMNDRDFWTTVFLQSLHDDSVERAAERADEALATLRERFGPVHFTVRQPTTDPMVDRVIHAANRHARAHSADEPDRLKADFSSGVRASQRNVDRDRTNEPGAQ